MGQSCTGGWRGDEEGMFLRMDDLISVWRSSGDTRGSRSRRNIFTGSVVFMSCCSFRSSTSQSALPSARQCLSPPKHLIFRLSAAAREKERLKSPDGTSALSGGRHRLEFQRFSSRSDFSAVSNRGLLRLCNAFRTVSLGESGKSGRRSFPAGFEPNELASSSLMQKRCCHNNFRLKYPEERLLLNKLSVSKNIVFSFPDWFPSLIGRRRCVFWYLLSTQVTLVDANYFVMKWAN